MQQETLCGLNSSCKVRTIGVVSNNLTKDSILKLAWVGDKVEDDMNIHNATYLQHFKAYYKGMIPYAFDNLGGKESPEDSRDFKLSLGATSAPPAIYMPPEFFNKRVFYQRKIPDCGANAGAFIAAYLDETPEQEYSPDYQWIDIKTFDGFALSDGTDMRSIFKSLTNGSIPYNLLPEKTTLPLAEFSSANRITTAMKKEAASHTIQAYGFHTEALTFAALKSLIYINKALVLLVRLGDEFWTDKKGNTSWAEKDILPLRKPNSIVSGHFIVVGAYDKDNIYFANWWSGDWGRKGYGYFKENYLPQITQVGTVVDSIEKVIVPMFMRDLYLGITGGDVKELQKYLNKNGFFIATYGPGSPGFETDTFGTLTQNALIRFQKAKNITPAAGFFGPKTRAIVNK